MSVRVGVRTLRSLVDNCGSHLNIPPFLRPSARSMSTKSSSEKNSTPQNINATRPYVVCGPSGSGKTTLLEMLFKHYQHCFSFSVSHTTRKKRADETQDKSYHFVDVPTFEKMIEANEFVEYSQFSGNLYGTSFASLELVKRSGQIPILDLDIRGVMSLKKVNFDAKYVFITVPTLEDLERNLRKRGSEDVHSLQKRLDHAIQDTKLAQNVAFDVVIVNADLQQAFKQFKQFVQSDVERLRPSQPARSS